MTDIDDRIGAALDADDRAFLEKLDDGRGLFRQIGDSLNGPLGGWAKLMFAVTFVIGIALVYFVWQLVTADSLEETILWATATLTGLIMQGFLKQWFFSRMNMIAILRELKRLELQIAMLQDQRG
ncbi:DUF6768 family protein [Erythrobacter alti]|uniref:DUF6768 family protein n=1 Tax=Erythrobacter alti TaxID=1896145 RepID=UPI0030F495D3